MTNTEAEGTGDRGGVSRESTLTFGRISLTRRDWNVSPPMLPSLPWLTQRLRRLDGPCKDSCSVTLRAPARPLTVHALLVSLSTPLWLDHQASWPVVFGQVDHVQEHAGHFSE